jgi:hypothetical protein
VVTGGGVLPLVPEVIRQLGQVEHAAIATAAKSVTSVTQTVRQEITSPIARGVTQAVQSVVNAVGKAGGGTGFPLLLLLIVAIFLIAQGRVDRRDPKLAQASVAADDTVEFLPPPSRGGGE